MSHAHARTVEDESQLGGRTSKATLTGLAPTPVKEFGTVWNVTPTSPHGRRGAQTAGDNAAPVVSASAISDVLHQGNDLPAPIIAAPFAGAANEFDELTTATIASNGEAYFVAALTPAAFLPASAANRRALNRAVFSRRARPSASYSGVACAPFRASPSFLKLASARFRVFFELAKVISFSANTSMRSVLNRIYCCWSVMCGACPSLLVDIHEISKKHPMHN